MCVGGGRTIKNRVIKAIYIEEEAAAERMKNDQGN